MNYPAAQLLAALAAATIAPAAPALTAAVTSAPGDPVVVTDQKGDIDSGVDLLRTRLTYRDTIRVRLVHDDLVPYPDHGVGVSIGFDTDPDENGPEFQFVGGLFQETDYALVHSDGWKQGKRVPPKGCFYRLRLQYKADRSLLRVDPGCLGDPDQVRISVHASADLADGTQHDWLTKRRTFTPWAVQGE